MYFGQAGKRSDAVSEFDTLPLQWSGPGFSIGLTGGVGSGKSTAGRVLAECGARVLDADRTAKEVLHSEELKPRLVERFGPGILDDRGEVSRPALADLVFSDPERLKQLEGLIHPAVRARYFAARDALQPGEVLVYDVPLLFEAGLDEDFDLIVTISAPEQERMRRAQARSGWNEADWRRREAAQLPLSEKEKRADVVIRNDRGESELTASVQALYRAIKEHRPT